MVSLPTVRIGMVGAGYMGQFAHLANFTQIEGCQVVALAEMRPQLRKKVAEAYHIPEIYSSHKELLAKSHAEAIVAILPPALTYQVGRDVLLAGRHLMTEKPMATSLREAEELAELAAKRSLVYMVGFMKRHDDGVLLARRQVEEWRRSGAVGAMTFARAHVFCGDWRLNFGKGIESGEPRPIIPGDVPGPEWMNEGERRLFASFINVAIHNINLLRFLTGCEFEVLSAAARGSTLVALLRSGETLASLERGIISSNKWEEHTKLFFEHGWVEVRTPPPLRMNTPAEVEIYEAGDVQRKTQPMAPWTWAFRRQAEHFVECLRTGSEPRSSGRDSVNDMRLAEAIFRRLRA